MVGDKVVALVTIVAFDFWVSVEVWRAVADRLVADHLADGAASAVAGFHALLAQTGLLVSALGVGLAADHKGCNIERIS